MIGSSKPPEIREEKMILTIKTAHPPLYAIRDFVNLFQIEPRHISSIELHLVRWRLCIAGYNPEWWRIGLSTAHVRKIKYKKRS
jgi:hypothetical protein